MNHNLKREVMDSLENTLPQGTPQEETQNLDSAQVEQTTQPEVAAEAPIEEPAAEEPAAEEPAAEAPTEELAAEAPAEELAAEAPAEEPDAEEPDAEEVVGEEPATDMTKKIYASKEEVLERIKELAHGEEQPRKDEVDHLKTAFYRFHSTEREEAMKAYIEGGGDPATYQVPADPLEETFKAEMELIKEKRHKAYVELEKEKENNLKRKLEIIESIKNMATSPEEANKSFQEFKKLQAEWREIKSVPAERANELWRNYQHYVEQFYDLLKLNSEAREYDFKKNLELKYKLCEAAERLADEPDVISAFHQLQELHQQYRETGPVTKELREEVWTRFKAASTVINKRHQQHFENLRSKEEENLERKTALCEKVEQIVGEENKGAADWERHTKEIIALQNEWKTIGFAPQKMNVKIFERFRAACDDFFGRKTQFFRDMKSRFAENAAKKRELIARAKEMQDSTDWKTTADKFVALQKEWKEVGVVPKRLGDQLWNEFLGACNKFFDARKAATSGTRNAERANLAKKREIIGQLKAIATEGGDDAQEKVQALVEEYNAVGHVPFRDKDKLYNEYHEALDMVFKELNISVNRRRLDNFRSNLKQVAEKGAGALDNERSRLMRRYETLKQEIQTYENNIGFLNVSSKKGNSLIDEMNRKVDKLKDDLKLVYDKIKAIDEENSVEEEKDEEA